MGRIIRYTLAGMLGAIIGWLLMEWTPLMPDEVRNISYSTTFIVGLISGAIVGLMMGFAEAVGCMSPRDFSRSILYGVAVGAAGGILGMSIGSSVFNTIVNIVGGWGIYDVVGKSIPSSVSDQLPSAKPGLFTFFLLLIGRGVGWALLGGFVGLSMGIAKLSGRKMVSGMIGGLIGGGLGGSVFEILVWISISGGIPMAPFMIRFITFAITGASIGLFIGLVTEVAKKAWLVRLVGRNEGKQYEIDKPNVVIGRSEMADLMVFGDPDVAENHAKITLQGQRYLIEDLGSYFGTVVNSQKVAREYLRDGDTIILGKTKFLFHDKATAGSGGYGSSSSGYDSRPSIPTNQHICPFCGAVKDANGNCDCTVGSSPNINPNPNPTPASPPAASPFDDPMQTVQTPPVQQSQPTQALNNNPTAIPAGQGAKLVAITGPYSGQTYILGNSETQIGREATKDIGMPTDNTVSRNHAKIVLEPAGYVVYDTGSTNGTYVNNARVMQYNLTNGDVVQIGSTKFRFEVN